MMTSFFCCAVTAYTYYITMSTFTSTVSTLLIAQHLVDKVRGGGGIISLEKREKLN